MKKHTEKPPIDELFARKLGNASLPPSADGFARLQARMGQQKLETKVVFWRNPDVQRYMAAAACLLLICLFGWLYWPSSGNVIEQGQGQVAKNQTVGNSSKKDVQKQLSQRKPEEQKTNVIEKSEFSQNSTTDQVTVTEKTVQEGNVTIRPEKRSNERAKAIESVPIESVAPLVAQVKPNEGKTQNEAAVPTPIAPANQVKTMPADQVAEVKPVSKPIPISERVLVVTIAEPEALVAARQMAKVALEEKAVVAQNEKPEKETKGGSFWQQVKRIKQGEVFARQDNTNNEDSGLLGRAYSGLKHSLDKDKSAKQ